MNKIFTAEIVERSTGRVLWRISEKPLNKYFWEKAKLEALKFVAKKREIAENELEIKEGV